MPLFWRYLGAQYTKVFLLSVAAFTALLLVSRLEETAKFAAMGASWKHVLLLNLYEMPHMLPIAIPISSLLSAFLLLRRLSVSYELTALRASGLSQSTILAPVLIAAAALSIVNFALVSELTTRTHLASRVLIWKLTSANPLALLNNDKFLRREGIFVTCGQRKGGERADNLLLVSYNKSKGRLNVIDAQHLHCSETELTGEAVSFLSSLDSGQEEGYDHLLVENQMQLRTPAADFAALLKNSKWRLSIDHLSFPYLLVRMADEKAALALAQTPSDRKEARNRIWQIRTEETRRVALGFSPFIFTLLGACYGMALGRRASHKPLIALLCITAASLVCFVAGKESAKGSMLGILLFITPYLIMPFFSLVRLTRFSSGKEIR